MPCGVRLRVVQHVKPNLLRCRDLLSVRRIKRGDLCGGKLLSSGLIFVNSVPSRLLLPHPCAVAFVPSGKCLPRGLPASVPVPARLLLSTKQLCAHAVHCWPLLCEQQLLSAAVPRRHVLLQGRSVHARGLFGWHILV